MDDDLTIPQWLKEWTPAAGRGKAPLIAPPPLVPRAVEVARQETKKIKTSNRIEKLKSRAEFNGVPEAFRMWDGRHWVDERQWLAKRLAITAERLGIPLENKIMDKITVLPYSAEGPLDRGKTSLRPEAESFELHDKIRTARARAGSKTVRVEVVSPAGEVTSVWVVDTERKLLHNDYSGVQIPFTQKQEEVSDMATKRVKKAVDTSVKKPGIIATIVETLKRDRGASAEELLAVLTKKFPERDAAGMTNTIKIQAAKNAKKKLKDDKRGLVYYA